MTGVYLCYPYMYLCYPYMYLCYMFSYPYMYLCYMFSRSGQRQLYLLPFLLYFSTLRPQNAEFLAVNP